MRQLLLRPLIAVLILFLVTHESDAVVFQPCPCLEGGPCLCGPFCKCGHNQVSAVADEVEPQWYLDWKSFEADWKMFIAQAGKNQKEERAESREPKDPSKGDTITESKPNPNIPFPDEVEPKWWVHTEYGKDILYLWQGDYRCLGFWDHKKGLYIPFKSKKDGGAAWLERKTDIPPMNLPPGYVYSPAVKKVQDPSKPALSEEGTSDNIDVNPQYFGGPDPSQLSMVDRFVMNGVTVPPRDLIRKLELADDSNVYHVTVLCEDKALRERILSDFKQSPALAPFVGHTRVQAYDPKQKVATIMLAPFQLERDSNFQRSRFAIYVQPPVGKDGTAEVYPLYTYRGPEDLAQFIRKCDPLYNPDRNPSPGGAADFLGSIPGAAWVLIAGFVLLLFVAIGRKPNRAVER